MLATLTLLALPHTLLKLGGRRQAKIARHPACPISCEIIFVNFAMILYAKSFLNYTSLTSGLTALVLATYEPYLCEPDFPIHETLWSKLCYPTCATPVRSTQTILFLSGQQQHQANKRGRHSRWSPAQRMGQLPQTPHLFCVWAGGKMQTIFHRYRNLQESESIDY